MTADTSQQPPPSTEQAQLLRLWEKTEDVAMHFNELILNLRLKVVGAITVGAGLFGSTLITRENAVTPHANYVLFEFAMGFLAVVLAAFIAIDLFYYQRLLHGAVIEAIRLERATKGLVQLSITIERVVTGKEDPGEDKAVAVGLGRWLFYGLPLAALLLSLGFAHHADQQSAPADASATTARAEQRGDIGHTSSAAHSRGPSSSNLKD